MEQAAPSKLLSRLPEESVRFIVNSVAPVTVLVFIYIFLAHSRGYWIAVLAAVFVTHTLSVLTILNRVYPIEIGIFVNLLIFSATGYLANPDAPYWLLYMPPIVPIALTVARPVPKYALLASALVLCAGVGYLKEISLIDGITNLLAIGILSVFSVRISQFLRKQQAVIVREREIADQLLENVLPSPVARRMKTGEINIVDGFDSAAILFADIVGFTNFSEKRSPEELVQVLDQIFTLFDDLAGKNDLEKIKTIGDAYMAASGLPHSRENYLENMATFALELKKEFAALSRDKGYDLQVRIGLHCGRVVAGVIGRNKFLYDVWGDVVNTASRMESHGEPGRVHCSAAVYEQLKHKFQFESRGIQNIKGKGPMPTYFLEGASAT